MKSFLSVFALIALTASIAACGGSGGNTPVTPGLADCSVVSGEALICGTVLAADNTPLINADIQKVIGGVPQDMTGYYTESASADLTKSAQETKCRTDALGKFACGGLIASGAYDFQISSGLIIKAFSSSVTIDTINNIPAADTKINGSDIVSKWLAVRGAYDGVQLLLSQLKGCTLTGDSAYPAYLTSSAECTAVNLEVLEYADIAATFASLSNISGYDAIFVNCATDMSAYATVLQEYVAGGGNLYFSDLSDTGVTAAFPDKVIFGNSGSTTDGDITADIDYAPLATYLDSSTMTVEFDLDGWMPIASVAAGVTTYISGDTSGIGGSVGAPITVGWKEGSGGCVFYTSYHIEAASTGSPQENALKYLILNANSVCE